MPKIVSKSKPAALPDPVQGYRTVGYPESLDTLQQELWGLRNLQTCTCDHDRCCHSNRAGSGERQVVIVDCLSAGRCLVKGCKCGAFVFSFKNTSPEGKKRRRRERELADVVPPSEGKS